MDEIRNETKLLVLNFKKNPEKLIPGFFQSLV